MNEKFSNKAFDKWLQTEFEANLKRFPIEILKHVKTDKNTKYIVLSSACRQLCFNEQEKGIKEAFSRAIETLIK
jgi:hypothetical protein